MALFIYLYFGFTPNGGVQSLHPVVLWGSILRDHSLLDSGPMWDWVSKLDHTCTRQTPYLQFYCSGSRKRDFNLKRWKVVKRSNFWWSKLLSNCFWFSCFLYSAKTHKNLKIIILAKKKTIRLVNYFA